MHASMRDWIIVSLSLGIIVCHRLDMTIAVDWDSNQPIKIIVCDCGSALFNSRLLWLTSLLVAWYPASICVLKIFKTKLVRRVPEYLITIANSLITDQARHNVGPA